MFTLNLTPCLYLLSSGSSALLSLGCAYKSVKELTLAPFGKDSIATRICRLFKEAFTGKFSIRHFFFSEEKLSKKLSRLSGASSYALATLVLGYLSYYLFNQSKAPLPVKMDENSLCLNHLSQYHHDYHKVEEQFEFWKYSYCSLNEKVNQEAKVTQTCFHQRAWLYPLHSFYCEPIFNTLTQDSIDLDLLPRQRFNQMNTKLKSLREDLEQECPSDLIAFENHVNNQCNDLAPYIQIHAGLFCKAASWVQTGISKECLKACDFYQKHQSYLSQDLSKPLRSTKNIHFNCSTVLEEPLKFDPLELEKNNPKLKRSNFFSFFDFSKSPEAYAPSLVKRSSKTTSFVEKRSKTLMHLLPFFLNDSHDHQDFLRQRRKVISMLENRADYEKYLLDITPYLSKEDSKILKEATNVVVKDA